jgi:PAS domain S-box-containing protein
MILPLHLLLAADEPGAPLLDALRRAGYDPRPHYAATPKAVGVALERRRPDAVLVGPDVSRAQVWEVLGWVQRHPSPPPLLVIADEIDDATVVALLQEGVRDVVKVAQLERLGGAVARAIRSHQEQASLSPGPSPIGDSTFHALAEHVPVGLYRSTEDGRILYANPALAQMLGRDSVEDLLGEPVVDSVKYPREEFARQIEQTGEVHDFEMRWTRVDGHEIITCETARAIHDAEGSLLYYEGMMEDVTEERRALDNERRRVEQLEAIVRFSTAVDAAQSSDDLYHAIVRVVEETMRADVAVLLERGEGDFDIQAWSQSISYEEVQMCRKQEVWKAYSVEAKPLLVRDERALQGAELVAPLRAFMRRACLRSLGSFPLVHRGDFVGALVVFMREPHTFSEGELRMAETLAWHVAGALSRWKAEAELRANETILRTITDTTGHVPYRFRFGANTYDHLSPSIERLTGYSAEQLQAAGGIDALTETYRVIEGAELKDGHEDAEAHYLALHHLRTANGDLRWVENSAYPWVDETGRIVGLVGVLQDVTERHAREAAAREQTHRSLAQQRALNELSALNADADTVLRRTTEVAAQTTGADRVSFWFLNEEAGEMQCRDLFLLESKEHRADQAPAVPAMASMEVLGQHRVVAIDDLHDQPLDSSLEPGDYVERVGMRALLSAPIWRQGQVTGFVTFAQTDEPRSWTLDEQDFAGAVADLVALTLEREQRARAEAALRESERRYRAISTLASDYAYALRVEPGGVTHVEWATDAFERISGYDPEEVPSVTDLLGIVHKEDRPAFLTKLQELVAGETIELEVRIVTKAGEERWICHRSRPVRDDEGRIRHVYSTGQDITDRKRFEEALVEAREQAEEMAKNKSSFLANMSHEIRTPLTGIIGFAGVLAEEIGEEHREFAHLIERSGRRLLETINSVLDLAQLESDGLEPTPEPLNLVEEARQAVLLLSSLAEQRGLDLHLRAEQDEVMVAADPTCLHRVFNNIVGNAIKFTNEGEVGVEVRASEGRAYVEVWDSGVGIDAEFLPHLFSEFRQETKKNENEGSGLGLAITKKLVELMDGAISVESTKGEGSRFTIAIPLLAGWTGEQRPAGERTVELDRPEGLGEGVEVDGTVPDDTDSEGAMAPSLPFDVEAPSDWGGDGVAAEAAPANAARDRTPVSADNNLETAPREAELQAAGDGALDDHEAPADSEIEREHPSLDEAATDGGGVLVVTDSEEIRERLAEEAPVGCPVEVVAEARVALDRMAKKTYEALVLDVNLGGKQTGAGVLRVARALPGYDGAFAVALTAAESERAPFMEAGFDYCLSESLTHRSLLGILSRARARRSSV